MSKTTLSESSTPHQNRQDSEKITHIKTDNDENDKDFKRLTLYTKHPMTDEEIYWEFSKQASADLLTKETDDSYTIETTELDYLKELWEANEWHDTVYYYQGNPLFKTPGENDLPTDWQGEIPIMAKEPAMWDHVYVNKEKVKVDYQVGCTGEEGAEIDTLVNSINSKFSNQPDFKAKEFNIIGKYLDNHTIRPPYTSNNTITFYEMYYDKAVYQNLLTSFKVPDHSYNYRYWYGKKYDIENSKEYLKIVIVGDEKTDNYQKYPNSFIMRPPLPVCRDHYFAKIYDVNGVEADEYDVFFTTSPNIMKAHCEKYSLDFPLPDNKMKDTVWNFGIVYDKNNLQVKQVKAYIKYPQNPVNWLD